MTKTKRIIIISLLSSISVVLDIFKKMIPFLNMANGGSINISLIPLVIAGFIIGKKDGVITCLVAFLISSIFGLNSAYISPLQYFFDYILPTIILGLSGIFYKKKNIFEIEIGIIFVMVIRTLSIIISGMYFWFEGPGAGSFEAFIFSLTYNLPYSIGTLIVLMATVPLLVKSINKYLL